MRAILLGLFVFLGVTLGSIPAMAGDSGRDAVESALQRMSVEEKVGQLMMGYFRGPVFSPDLEHKIRDLHYGGIILYGITGNVEDPAQVAKLTSDIQTAGRMPLFVAIDQEGGPVERLTKGVTRFPGNMALGAAGDVELAVRAAEITAEELRLVGVNMNLAPVLDVNSNPANPIIGVRSYGSSPQEVARFGKAVTGAFARKDMIATVKHFPGHGDTSVDSHLGLPVVERDMSELRRTELYPFREVASTVPAVMTAHIILPALDREFPATLSPAVLGMLRKDIGFSGLIITDSLGMGAITKRWSIEEAAVRAFLAGADILLYGADVDSTPEDSERAYNAVLKAVRDGGIPLERLDASVRRILTTKQRYGLFANCQPNPDSKVLGAPEHQAVARQIAAKSLTLVKNEQNLLPVSPAKRVVLIWPAELADRAEPLLRELPEVKGCFIPLSPAEADRQAVMAATTGADVVLVGSYNLYRNRDWAEMTNSLDQKRAVVLALRSPYDLLNVPGAAGYVAAYHEGEASMAALGKLLRGGIAPQGRLPVALPGLFDRGWGLTAFKQE